jgi:hypothetical protein
MGGESGKAESGKTAKRQSGKAAKRQSGKAFLFYRLIALPLDRSTALPLYDLRHPSSGTM